MPGNLDGAQRAQSTLLVKFGSPEALHAWRVAIGRRGGSACVPKGFALRTHEEVSEIGRRGGSAPRRVSNE